MTLETLRLSDFRNFGDLEVDFAGRTAAVWGPNGMGKTNLLEAVFLLGTTRSHRTRKDAEMVRFGARGYVVGGVFRRSGGERTEIALAYEEGGRKRGRVDRKDVDRLASLVGLFGVVFVSPEDVEITRGGPDRRRQYLDLTLCSVDPVYLRALQEYNRAHRQRGRLLREGRGPGLEAQIDSWDRQLARSAVPLDRARREAVDRLSPAAERTYADLGGGERLEMALVPGSGEGAVDEEALLERLRAGREVDRRTGRTGVGPHRDDLEVLLDRRPIRSYGSRGQNRTAVLALKIGAARYMEERTGEKPLLLLDDVFTELDRSRSLALAERLRGEGQVFATGTDRGGLERYFPDAEWFSIREGGRLVREE
ncbi:MAG: DNA replication/repair protein RecF [Candidatus Eisenbacteria bacterium]|nr:DNA replication/repair protein RecF [Candidatus Eisenbacteria bacterium]